MIEAHVKWFCRWIDKPYQKRYTLDVWLTKANRTLTVMSIDKKEAEENEDQLTIFDYGIDQ